MTFDVLISSQCHLGSMGRPKRVKSLLPIARSFSKRIFAPMGAPRSAKTMTRSPAVTCGEVSMETRHVFYLVLVTSHVQNCKKSARVRS